MRSPQTRLPSTWILYLSMAAAPSSGLVSAIGCERAASERTPPAQALAPAPALPDLTDIKKALTELRGLEFLKDVPAEHQSMEDWGAYLDSELATMFPPERVEGLMAGLVRLGMLKEPIDLGEEFKSALLSQAGAYYDPTSGKFFYLMLDMAPQYLETVAAHELVHALQDQHFDLGTLMKEAEVELTGSVRDDDQLLAIRFLVEGEATYVQTVWQSKTQMGMDITASKAIERSTFETYANLDMSTIIAMSKQMDAGAVGLDTGDIAKAIEAMDSIPPYILNPLLAAYLKGAYFVMAVRQAGGWDGVAAAYKSLPETSEQVLHPEKFTGERDHPTRISLPGLAYLETEGWNPIDSARHGEFYLSLLLENTQCSPRTAKEATAGWDGDVYRAFQHEDGRVMFVLATTWDSELDARQFANAYNSVLEVKCGVEQPAREIDEAIGGIEYPAGGSPEDRGFLVRRGREVFVVEGVPSALGRRIVNDLRAMEVQHVD